MHWPIRYNFVALDSSTTDPLQPAPFHKSLASARIYILQWGFPSGANTRTVDLYQHAPKWAPLGQFIWLGKYDTGLETYKTCLWKGRNTARMPYLERWKKLEDPLLGVNGLVLMAVIRTAAAVTVDDTQAMLRSFMGLYCMTKNAYIQIYGYTYAHVNAPSKRAVQVHRT